MPNAHSAASARKKLAAEFLPAAAIPREFPMLFTPNQWKWALRKRHENGIYRAVRRLGGRLFVHTPTLLEVMQEQVEGKTP